MLLLLIPPRPPLVPARARVTASGKAGTVSISHGYTPLAPAVYVPTLSVEIDVTNDPTNPARVWTNISQYIREIQYSRSGRSSERDRTETGTLVALCDDRGGAISGLGIKKAQWIRVSAIWNGYTYPRWQGILESLPRRWPNAGNDEVIELHAADVLKVFRLYDLAGQTFPAHRNGERVAAIAALAGVAMQDLDAATDLADAVTDPIAENTDALSLLQTIEDSEVGLLVAETNGKLSFQGRHWRALHSRVSRFTLGETAGYIPYQDTVVREDDDSRIANKVVVSTPTGAQVVVADSASQAKYWTRPLYRTLQSSDLNLANSAAAYLLSLYRDPAPHIPSVSVQLAAVPNALKQLVLVVGNSDRVTWKRQASSALSEFVYIEQVTETVRPGPDWTISFNLSPASAGQTWILGDSTYGKLEQTTWLTY